MQNSTSVLKRVLSLLRKIASENLNDMNDHKIIFLLEQQARNNWRNTMFWVNSLSCVRSLMVSIYIFKKDKKTKTRESDKVNMVYFLHVSVSYAFPGFITIKLIYLLVSWWFVID